MTESNSEEERKCIAEMSKEERVDAFLEEIVSPIIGDSAIDDEETKLLDAMLVLFRLTAEEADPPPSWIMRKIMDNDGCEKAKLDSELDAAIERRMDEGDHQLNDEHIRDLENWQSYRKTKGESNISEPSDQWKPETPDEREEETTNLEKGAQRDDATSTTDEGVDSLQKEEIPEDEPPAEKDDDATPDLEEEAQQDDSTTTGEGVDTLQKEEIPKDGSPSEEDEEKTPDQVDEEDGRIVDPPAPPPPPPPSLASLTLIAGKQRLSLNITTKLSASLVRQFGENSEYWDEDWQMTTEKRGNEWYLVPNTSAANETILNGQTVTSPVKLSDGDEIGAGSESKGIVKLPLTVKMAPTT